MLPVPVHVYVVTMTMLVLIIVTCPNAKYSREILNHANDLINENDDGLLNQSIHSHPLNSFQSHQTHLVHHNV